MATAKPPEDAVPVKIERVLVSQQEAVIVLATQNGKDFAGKVVPVFVDLGQAMNIQVSLEGRMMGRPLTHDLFTNILNEMGAIVERVVIEDLAQNTFFATLHVEIEKNGGRKSVQFDARPSDCIALAVRSGAAIMVRRRVLDQAAVDREKFFGAAMGDEGGAGESGEEEGEEVEGADLDEEEEDEDDEPKPPRRKGGDHIDPSEAERP